MGGAIVGTIFALGCGEPSLPPLATTLTPVSTSALGCWILESPGWTSPFLPGSVMVRLDTSHVSQYNEHRVLTLLTSDSAYRRHARHAEWGPTQTGSSIWVGIGDGFSGLDFRLDRRGDSLMGRAYRYTDFEHFRSSGPILGARRSCAPAA